MWKNLWSWNVTSRVSCDPCRQEYKRVGSDADWIVVILNRVNNQYREFLTTNLSLHMAWRDFYEIVQDFLPLISVLIPMVAVGLITDIRTGHTTRLDFRA